MYRIRIYFLAFALACLVCGPALAAEQPLTLPEQREVLQALQELEAARVLIVDLQALVNKDEATITALRGQVDAIQHLVDAQDKMLGAVNKVVDLQQQAVGTYRDLAAASDKRAEVNLARAERAESWVWKAGVIGFVAGFVSGAGAVALLTW